MDVYSFGIDFCQIWYVFNLLKQVLGPFFMVLDLFFHFYFWTRNGSKMGFCPLVFRGLKFISNLLLHVLAKNDYV